MNLATLHVGICFTYIENSFMLLIWEPTVTLNMRDILPQEMFPCPAALIVTNRRGGPHMPAGLRGLGEHICFLLWTHSPLTKFPYKAQRNFPPSAGGVYNL